MSVEALAGYNVAESSQWLLGVFDLWFAGFAGASLGFGYLSLKAEAPSFRIGYNLSAMINFIAAMAYFAMSHQQGRVWLLEGTEAAEIFWVRYADWTFTTPLLLVHLCMFSGLAWDQWTVMLLADVLMILTGLAGDLVVGDEKWIWFAFACLFQVIIAAQLLGPGRKGAMALGPREGDAYDKAMLILLALWLPYPVVWAFDHGTGMIDATTAGASYAALDLAAKPFYSALLMQLPLHASASEGAGMGAGAAAQTAKKAKKKLLG